MKYTLLSICLFLSFNYLNAQNKDNYKHGSFLYPDSIKGENYVDIQYLELNKNEFLLQEIRKYIQEQTDTNRLFRDGFGFIVVRNITVNIEGNLSNKDTNDSVIEQFTISAKSYALTENFVSLSGYCQACFPSYYSIIDNRLVLIEDKIAYWLHQNYYSSKSKKELIYLVNNTLVKCLDNDFTFIDLFRNEFKLSDEQRKKLSRQEILILASFMFEANKIKYVTRYKNGRTIYQFH